MSLKQILYNSIKLRGQLTTWELEGICKQENYKLSNAERRLRPSESPDIESIKKNGIIVGYRIRKEQSTLF